MQILDSYKVNGRPFRFEELENGNFKRVWEGRNYDYMMKSDISGQNVRFYVETENGVALMASVVVKIRVASSLFVICWLFNYPHVKPQNPTFRQFGTWCKEIHLVNFQGCFQCRFLNPLNLNHIH